MKTADYPFEFTNFDHCKKDYPWLVILEDYGPSMVDPRWFEYQAKFGTRMRYLLEDMNLSERGKDYNYCYDAETQRVYVIFKDRMKAVWFRLAWYWPTPKPV
jgi:hypothetical protein